MSYFNDDQIANMEYLNTLPRDQKCLCGWYPKGKCPHARCQADHAVVAPAEPQTPEPTDEYLRELGALRDMLNAPQSIGLWKVTVFTNPQRLAALDAAIAALKQSAAPVSSSARLARTLKDYRPQHDERCLSRWCDHVSNGERCGKCESTHERSRGITIFHNFKAAPCSCGLDALLSGGAPHGRGVVDG